LRVFLKLTADQSLVYRLDRGLKSRYFSGREKEGVLAKAKFRRKLTPDALLTFLLTYSLYNRLLERSLIYCVRNFYNLGIRIRSDFSKHLTIKNCDEKFLSILRKLKICRFLTNF